MAIINKIPSGVEERLDKLNKLNESTFEDILSALNHTEPTIFYLRLIEEISSQIKNISPIDLQDIFRGVSTFINYDKSKSFGNEKVVNQIVKLIDEGKTDKIKFNDKKQPAIFKQRMLSLLNNETFAVTQEAADVYYSQNNLLASSDINVDIRPIFYKGKSNYAVMHNLLHLNFNSDGELQSIYIALDRNDIEIFKRVIEEAEHKIKTMESAIEKMGMKELRVSKEE